MWVFTRMGFFSVVENKNRNNNEEVMVRARCIDDITRVALRLGTSPIINTPHADYPYRLICTKTAWANLMYETAEDIDYDNFKATVHNDPVRATAYARVWSAAQILEWLPEELGRVLKDQNDVLG